MMRIRYLVFLLAPLIQCASVPTIQPPKFDYSRLISNFIEKNPEGHFPLTVQRGNNTDPSASGTGYLFYASDLDGSSDIWMRDLRSTVNVPLVRHPAEQTDPYVTPDGKLLAYVSFELDAGGDIRLVAVDPEAIVEANLRGEDPPNLWFDSVNLSHYLDEVGLRLGPECKGSFSEKDPVLSPNGDEIYFVSDRCNPGTYRIWSLKLEEQESESLPVPVSPENSIQPSVSGDGRYLAYLVRPSAESPPRIEILDRSSGEQYRIPLEAGPERQPFLYFRPSLSLDGKSLYYGIIRKDTNRNGILDQADDAALAGISVEDVV
ncbi:MAG: PD40 domain-containing protein, partial [Leptospiraceae bacterium]|nr:PD40 domain-containing protein [Leptospiraceae bacterium]